MAAAAGFACGAAWYMTLSRQWIAAAGIPVDENGRPQGNGSPLPFVLSGVAMLLVAGMMRHVFVMSGVVTLGPGALAGFGIGAFFIAPWIMINNAYAARPFRLTVIDSGYAILACTIMGGILGAFGL